ncbi:MAG: (Fe-S)-binding protein [Acidobacteriota bacterium]|nr:(Fe-S)-binding protein [Acidobacteriota bacterium]
MRYTGDARQILWNIPLSFVVATYLLLALLIVAFGYAGLTWYRRVSLGTQPADSRSDRLALRVWRLLVDAFAQKNVACEPWGWVHTGFYFAFLGLTAGTTIVFINSDLRWIVQRLFGVDIYFFKGNFYVWFKTAMDICFLVLAGGIVAAGLRRGIARPALLAPPSDVRFHSRLENRLGYWFPLLMFVLVAFTGVVLEGARINAAAANERSAFAGRVVADMFGSLGGGLMLHRTLWLVHMMAAFGLFFAIPFSKLRHLVMGPVNLLFRDLTPRGRLAPIPDFENAERYGVSRVEQYSWKQLLDLSSCLECGRCTINCPTVATGKALNPKFFILDQREHLLDEAPALLAAGLGARGDVAPGRQLIGDVVQEQEIWDCTNCGWCEQACPVAIKPIQQIAEMRRHLVLMEGKFPHEAAAAFKGIEVLGNPWNLPSEQRFDWADGLGVRQMSEVEDPDAIEVLYWVGCAGSYDERNKRVSRAFARVMQQAGVKFATLGREESCTGDLARRLGNEYLYATVATANLETLNKYKPKRIVTQCPHCYHNLKKEYPDFGSVEYEVVHEAEFIAELVETKRLHLTSPMPEKVTYHDPCFMARHDQKSEGARTVLHAIPDAEIKDVDQSRERTFCCGAGGGGFWKEEVGKPRINETRFVQLTVNKPAVVATGCPFCMTMMTDAMNAGGGDESMQVRDLAELVAEAAGLQKE